MIMIFSSLVFLILVILEGASGFALRSRAEGICMLAGESMLSEYQKTLWSRYGIFAVRSSNERLTALADFYIDGNLAVQGDNLLRMEKIDCLADSQEYPALDGEQFACQIRNAASILIVRDILFDGESESICSEIREALSLSETLQKGAEEGLRQIEETPETDGEDLPVEERARMRSLIKRYETSGQPPEDLPVWEKSIPPGSATENLPTKLLGLSSQRMLLSSGVIPRASAPMENEYILEKCSYATRLLENSLLDLEVEYVLFGLPSDPENDKEVRNSLFWLRSALNLSHIYSDPEKRTEVTTLAASVLTLIPLPVAVFIVAGIWSSVEARNDVEMLFSGETVPFLKTPDDWACSLDGALRSNVVEETIPGAAHQIGTYGDYLRLLLLMVAPEKKRARLMDVMQLNIAQEMEEPFCFQDYAYGFTLQAVFEKQLRLHGSRRAGKRIGKVCQEHAYQ